MSEHPGRNPVNTAVEYSSGAAVEYPADSGVEDLRGSAIEGPLGSGAEDRTNTAAEDLTGTGIEDLVGAVLVTCGERVVLRAAAGLADAATGQPSTPETCFRVSSVGKLFTAAVVLSLAEDGVLDLHRPIGRWLPQCPEVWDRVTLHHLLCHTAGLGHWRALQGFDLADPCPREDYLPRLARQPLLSEPGAEFRYSSPGYGLAARVAEAAAGEPYEDMAARMVFKPLGLESTSAELTPPGPATVGHRNGVRLDPRTFFSLPGSGDVWSTVDDLLRFAQAFDAGAVLTEASRGLMTTVHTPIAPPEGSEGVTVSGYGYGCFLGSFEGDPVFFHPGKNLGYRSLYTRIPALGSTIVLLSNEHSTDLDRAAEALTPLMLGIGPGPGPGPRHRHRHRHRLGEAP